MAKYVDEFESLFLQLERMGDDTKIPQSHKTLLLLEIMNNSSLIESTVVALRTQEPDQLSWKAVSADQIHAWTQTKFRTHQKGNPKVQK